MTVPAAGVLSPSKTSPARCVATVTANGTAGSYNVTASATGATSVNFALTNGQITATVTLSNLLY